MKLGIIVSFFVFVFLLTFVFAEDLSVYDYSTSTSENISSGNNFSHLNVSGVTPYDSLILYLPFDSNVSSAKTYDYSGSGNDGTIQNAIWNSSGKYGGAYEFIYNASLEYRINTDIYLDQGSASGDNYTFMAWVRPNSVFGTVMGTDNGNTDWSLLCDLTGYWKVWDGSGSSVSSLSVDVGEWQFVTAVFEKGVGIKIYKNDETPYSSSTITYDSSYGHLTIGHGAVWGSSFNGSIDEVMLFNRVLNASEILSIYNNQSDRFKTHGKEVFDDIGFTAGMSRINISSQVQNLLGTVLNLSISYFDGDWHSSDVQTVEDNNSLTFRFSNSTTNITLNYSFFSDTYYFYTPILEKAISLVTWSAYVYPTIISPTGLNYYSSLLGLNFSLSNHYSDDVCWYSLDEGLTNNSLSCDDSINVDISSLSEGPNNITLWVNDSFGNINFTVSNFLKDSVYPIINFVFPTPDNNTGIHDDFGINVSVDEPNLKNLSFNWNGTNYSFFDDGLILAYNFDNRSSLGENGSYVVDISNAENNGTVYGASWNSSGKYGGAYEFDGYGDYIDTGLNPYIEIGNSNSFTISVWVKPNNITVNQEIIGSWYANNKRFYLGVIDGSYYWGLGSVYDWTTQTVPIVGEWQHLVFVYDIGSGSTLLYLNGNNSYSEAYSGNVDMPNENIPIGGGTVYFNGTIDEVNIWNRSLSSDEVNTLYNSQLTKYNSSQWGLYVNRTSLSVGDSVSYFVSSSDKSGNNNRSGVRTVKGDSAPVFNSLDYSPMGLADLDPNVIVSIDANISDSDGNFDSAILQWKNSTQDYGVNNISMSNLSEVVATGTLFNASFQINEEGNYSFRIFANDTEGSSSFSSEYNLSVFWDCTWGVESVDLGATAGYDENKNIGNITIINTGDSNYSNNNCTLDFRLTYNLDQGRIYYDDEYYKNLIAVDDLVAGANSTIEINATYDTEIKQEDVIITLDEFRDISNLTESNISATLVTNREGPYLYQSITSSPTSIYLTAGNFSLNGYIKNLMGSILGNETNTAYNVSSTWVLPSVFTNSSGMLTANYENISNSSAMYNNLNLTFLNLESMTPGVRTFSFSSYGRNLSGSLIRDVNNNTVLSDSVNFTFLCYNASDGICVTSCGYLLDSDCKQETTSTSTTSSGGGGGGGGGSISSETKNSELSFELLRGNEQSFALEFYNNFNFVLRNIKIDVSGLNSKYISVEPSSVFSLNPGQMVNYTVLIDTPSYFSKNTYNLNFKIQGELYSNGTFMHKFYNENKRVTLYLVEVKGEDAFYFLNESENFVDEMNNSGMVLDEVLVLLEKARDNYEDINFLGVKKVYGKLKNIYESAFSSMEMIEELNDLIENAEKNGIDVIETKKLLYLSETAYRRGDYILSFKRLSETKLTYALETKGEFNLIYKIKNNPIKSLGVFFSFFIFSLGSSYGIRIKVYKNRLKLLKEEEKILLELMKVVQVECFEKATMSMEEYDLAMSQYEHRFSEVVKEKINTETKLFNLLKFRGKKKSLNDEKEKLLQLMRNIQDDYLNKGKIETRVYDNMIKTYISRLTKVEEELTFLDAQEFLKSNNIFKKIFRRAGAK